jgi:hypothetical protein
MRRARRALIALAAGLVVAAMVAPAGSAIGSGGGADSPAAAVAKKKCKKKGKASKKGKCKKKGKQGGSYLRGRYSGTYAENNVDLFFNVNGGRVYTGPFDSFYIDAPCNFGLSDQSSIEPVQASIAGNGSFSGSGVWVVAGGTGPSGFSIPWKLTGQIKGGSITNGRFEVGPYSFSDGKTCSGATSFTAGWVGAFVL